MGEVTAAAVLGFLREAVRPSYRHACGPGRSHRGRAPGIEHDEHVEDGEAHGDGHEEGARQHGVRMLVDKRGPPLCRADTWTHGYLLIMIVNGVAGCSQFGGLA